MTPRERARSLRGLYAIVDPEQTNGRDPRAVCEAVLKGGAAIVQLRAKRLEDEALVALAQDLVAICARHDVPFVLNDRADLVARVNADGVHLGQGDLSAAEGRALIGETRILGRSTHDLTQVDAEALADLLGFGPVYPTTTKLDAEPVVGLGRLAEVVARTKRPLCAIGGIDRTRVHDVAATGVALVAAISAVTKADDIEAEARAMHEAVRRAAPAGLR